MFAPDAFATDAYGFLTNQLGHAAFGLVATGIVAFVMRLRTGHDMRAPALLVVAVAYFLGWEAAWQTLWIAGPMDALADTFFVVCGGWIGIALWGRAGPQAAAGIAAAGSALALGVWRRRR